MATSRAHRVDGVPSNEGDPLAVRGPRWRTVGSTVGEAPQFAAGRSRRPGLRPAAVRSREPDAGCAGVVRRGVGDCAAAGREGGRAPNAQDSRGSGDGRNPEDLAVDDELNAKALLVQRETGKGE